MMHMLMFHVRSVLRTTYFVQLMVTSTVSILTLQLLAVHATGASGDSAWLRAGLVGAWTINTVSAGIVGFQRFQGTLAHLSLTPRPAGTVFLPLVAGPATVGLGAFPVAAVASVVLGVKPEFSRPWSMTLGFVCFWLTSLAMACAIASLFVLTPNAITYEGLLVVPLLLLSGVFGIPEGWLAGVTYVLPTAGPVRFLLGDVSVGALALSVATTILWFLLAAALYVRAIRRARFAGTLEVA